MDGNDRVLNVSRWIQFSTLVAAVVLASLATITYQMGYDRLLLSIATQTNHLHVLDKLKVMLPYAVFQSFLLGTATFAFVAICCSFFSDILAKNLAPFLAVAQGMARAVGSAFQRLRCRKHLGLWILMGAHAIHKGFYFLTMPVSYDEAWTYLNFTKNGFLTSLSYYPAPNNHILYSLFTNLTDFLPIDSLFALRSVAFIVSFLILMVFYYMLIQLASVRASLAVSALFSFLFPTTYYSYMARGYGLVTLSFLICFYAFIKMIYEEKSESWHYPSFFALGAMIGFSAMPSFLYAFMSLFVYLCVIYLRLGKYRELKRLVAVSCASGVSVLLFYTPVLIVSGFNALVHNDFVRPIPRLEVLVKLIPHYLESFDYFFGPYLFIGVAIVLGWTSYRVRGTNCKIVAGCRIVCLLALFIPFIHGVIAFHRTWIYLIVPVAVVFAIFIDTLPTRIKNVWFTGCVTILCVISALNVDARIRRVEKTSFLAADLVMFLKNQKAGHLYVNHGLFDAYVRFLYDIDAMPLKLHYSLADANEIHTIKDDSLDYFILDARKHKPIKGFKTVFHNSFVLALKR